MLSVIAQATQPSSPLTDPSTWSLGGVLSTVLTALFVCLVKYAAPALVKWLESLRAAADASAMKDGLSAKGILVDHLKSYLTNTALLLIQKRLPGIAQRVKDGELATPEEVKKELSSWADELKVFAAGYFQHQGVDLYKEVGEPAIDMLISRAAEAVSAFPGMKASLELVKDGVSDYILSHGVNATRDRYKAGDPVVPSLPTVEVQSQDPQVEMPIE